MKPLEPTKRSVTPFDREFWTIIVPHLWRRYVLRDPREPAIPYSTVAPPQPAPFVPRNPEQVIAETHPAYLDYPYYEREERERIGEAYAEECAEEIEELIADLARLPMRSGFKRPVYGAHLDKIHALVGFQIAQLTPDVLSKPFDFQSVGADYADEKRIKGKICVKRNRIITLTEARGRIISPTQLAQKKLIEHRFLNVYKNGRTEEEATIYAYNDQLWFPVTPPRMVFPNQISYAIRVVDDASAQDVLTEVKLMVGIQYLTEFYWLAYFSKSATDYALQVALKPQTALNLFKYRDKPTHTTRRKALQHLVSPHWRDVPTRQDEAAMQVFVREHRRGIEWFRWLGLECAIVPALRDVQRLTHAKLERELLKKQGDHRRQKPTLEKV